MVRRGNLVPLHSVSRRLSTGTQQSGVGLSRCGPAPAVTQTSLKPFPFAKTGIQRGSENRVTPVDHHLRRLNEQPVLALSGTGLEAVDNSLVTLRGSAHGIPVAQLIRLAF
jgi:hypothetical protein